jgi:DHA1 family bicyclomycin/chloramphenicol resistance-like MFS transporter
MTSHSHSPRTTSPAAAQARIPTSLLLTLTLLAGLGPLASDMYLPTFPHMIADLATNASGVQLTLTAFLIGAGVGQLLFGPLSDRLGRLGPLVAGTAIFLGASVLAALAPNLAVLLIARLLQGLAGAAGMVISRAIVTDRAHGAEVARALSIIMLLSAIAPVIAPFAGSVLAAPIGWRGIMGVVAGAVAIALICVLVFVRESHPRGIRDQPTAPLRITARALWSRAYLGSMLAFVFSFAELMAYISASPFLYQTMIGLSQIDYGLAYALNVLVLMAVGFVSARLVRRHSVASLTSIGLAINLIGVLAFTALVMLRAPVAWYALAMPIIVGSTGLISGNTTALALIAIPSAAGLGSAILGGLQNLLAGAVVPVVNIAGTHTAVPLALTMLITALAADLAFALVGYRPHESADTPVQNPASHETETA